MSFRQRSIRDALRRGPFPYGVSAFPIGDGSVRLATVVVELAEEQPARVAWQVTSGDRPIADGAAPIGAHGRVTVDVGDLASNVEYHYRFEHRSTSSPVGTFRTIDPSIDRFRIGIASCTRSVDASPEPLDRLARASPDLILHLGDYIYEDDGSGPRSAPDPPWTCRSEDDFRTRLAQYRSDDELIRAHAAAPWLTVWDDHDVVDDLWRRGAATVDGGEVVNRRRHALAARRTFLPEPRGDGPGPFDRHLRVGGLADIVMLDARHHRDRPVGRGPTVVASDSPKDGMLSEAQWEWLERVAVECRGAWLLLVSSVQIAPMHLARVPASKGWKALVNPGQWDGYPASRRRLVDLLDARPGATDRGVVVLSGDLHGRFVVPRRSDDVLAEITTPAVSAPPFAELVRRRLHLPVPSRLLEAWIGRVNRHFATLELGKNGASIIDVMADRLEVRDQIGRSIASIERHAACPIAE